MKLMSFNSNLKDLLWSTRIGQIVPIWILCLTLGSDLERGGTVCHKIESPKFCHDPGSSVLGSPDPFLQWRFRVKSQHLLHHGYICLTLLQQGLLPNSSTSTENLGAWKSTRFWEEDPPGHLESSVGHLQVLVATRTVFQQLVVYYETIKRKLNRRLIHECRCDERLKGKAQESTRLTYAGNCSVY